MRKALIVGIDHYEHLTLLSGCVNDAHSVKAVLEHHADGSKNFVTPRMILGTGPTNIVKKTELKSSVVELFQDDAEIALFYYAGHGHIEDTGGYLCAGNSETGDDGLALSEIITLASKSPAKNKVIILDSCFSGAAGDRPTSPGNAELQEGMTILTASTDRQSAMEKPEGGSGVFTSLLVDALNGAAMNLVGDVTPGSVYAHIDQSLGPWGGQRPMFKTHVKSFVSLRKAAPPIALSELKALASHFPKTGYIFPLDPAYEPKRSSDDAALPPPDKEKNAVFAVLQNYVKVGLVRAVDADHMYFAAIESKSCQLTVLGEHYRNIVAQGLI